MPVDPTTSSENYQDSFLQHLIAIEANTKQLSTLLPKEIAKLSQSVGEAYGPSGKASRGTAGRPTPGVSGYSSLSGTNDATARAILAGTYDPTEADVEGGPSGVGMGGATWQDRVRRGGLGQILPMPRFPGAGPNTADLLNYASTVAANMAAKRQPAFNQAASKNYQAKLGQLVSQGLVEVDPDTGQPLGPLTQFASDSLTTAATPGESKLGGVSDMFSGMENAYVQGRYIKQMLSGVTQRYGANSAYGYQTGYQGAGQGFLGMPSPGSALAGLGQKASQFGFALNSNVSPGQASTIYNNLFSQGWYGGGSTNDMRTAAGQMMSQNPYIGSMPQYYSMMDQATRQGTASLQDFNNVMSQVPDLSKAAHTSITDTMNAMDQLGQYNRSIGGTYMGGLQNAATWQSVTGMPTAILQQLMQNPMVISQTYAASGLMPQLQGLATPQQHVQGVLSALNALNDSIIAPGATGGTDAIGLPTGTSGQAQKIGLIAQQLGVSPEIVNTMLYNKGGWTAGANIAGNTQDYQSAINTALQQGNYKGAYWAMQSGPYWGKLQSQLGQAVDSQGHKMFEDWNVFRSDKGHMSQAKAHAAAQSAALWNIKTAGYQDVLSDAHVNLGTGRVRMSTEEQQQAALKIMNSGKMTPQMIQQTAAARAAEITKYQTMNTKMFGAGNQGNNGPNLTIELGPAAKKMFDLTNPTGQQKAAINAGTATIGLNAYVNQYTASPTADLMTAGAYPSGDAASAMNNVTYGSPLGDGTY